MKALHRNCRYLLLLVAMLLTTANATAQCKFRNTAFKSGEYISYNLYFNWKFVWVKAGTASMSVVESNYRGRPAYRASLITRSSERVDQVFMMRDTLLCYNSTDMEPLYFRKGAREGKRYYVDEVFYTYPGGKTRINQVRERNGNRDSKQETLSYCVFDMMSIYLRARSFVPTAWKKGHVVDFPIVDGNSRTAGRLSYEGKTTVKADNGVRYRCLKLAFLEKEDDGSYKRIVDFFVTDDDNHLPVRLDLHLKFGSAKAFLVGMRGQRNPVESVVK